tara:strand:- start:1889 stop:3532 length:1644 start_codon:yes stop_codon:yes gene_type:complete
MKIKAKILLFLLFLIVQFSIFAEQNKMNVLLVMLDDIGPAWFPPYAKKLNPEDIEPVILENFKQSQGHNGIVDPKRHIEAAQNSMPFLDKMSKKGVVFDLCIATASLCAPSRAGLITGCFQQKWGGFDNKDIEHSGLQSPFLPLSINFKENGYATAIVGKWHLSKKDPKLKKETFKILNSQKKAGNSVNFQRTSIESGYFASTDPDENPLKLGFDRYYGFNAPGALYYEADCLWEDYKRVPKRPKEEFLTDHFNEKVIEFIDNSLKQKNPFFVYYAPMTLHGKMDKSPEKYRKNFNSGNKFTDQYAGHLLAVDKGLENIHETLVKYGQEDNTLILFSADNGQTAYAVPPYNAPYKGGKGTGWIGGLRVPLVIWGSTKIIPSSVSSVISLADLLPTALSFAGIPIPDHLDGKDWKPFLTGSSNKVPRSELFSTGLQSTRWSDGYELERNKKDSDRCPLYSWIMKERKILTYVSEVKKGLYKSLPNGRDTEVWFHNLSSDPKQKDNLILQNPETISLMRKKLNNWMKTLKEPLLNHKEDYKQLIHLTNQ